MVQNLVQHLLSGSHRALSRAITLIERQDSQVSAILQAIHPYTGNTFCIGITGPPGSGKSTLIDSLTTLLRHQQRSVGILAMDPTSPYTGGAILGDRIRMQRHYLDPGVYIRSIATRDNSGAITATLRQAVQLLDAGKKDVVLVETVGVGQTDSDIAAIADTVVVVLVPEAGDSIQVMKAGLMEAADIFVVNKADRAGSQKLIGALNGMLHSGQQVANWKVPVISTQTGQMDGIMKLCSALQEHRAFLESSSQLEARRRQRRRQAFVISLQEELHTRLRYFLERDSNLARLAQAVEDGDMDPITAAQTAIAKQADLSSFTTSN